MLSALPPRHRARADLTHRASQLLTDHGTTDGRPEQVSVDRRSMARVTSGFQHLYDDIHRVPAIVVPCVEGRTDGASALTQSMTWGSILPAVWSFMLAARSRGLGTVWTTAQGPLEREMAQILGVPYDEVMLAAFIPLAFTLGTDFRPALRIPRDQVLHRDRW
ncbi:nitroreductase family protein [Frankia sp. R82]|nr:nitroreductase family protein [Frankia sp. R82]MCM3885514.1 nitroreductase family protein [Frankia sp. R82]